MPFTRLQVETLLVGPDMLSGRAGRRMVFSKLYDPATATLGGIPALGDPIAEGLRSAGIAPADPTDPTDADLLGLPDAKLAQLLDVAELRILRAVLGNLDEVNEQEGTDRKDFGKYADHLLALIDQTEARLKALYGYGSRRRGAPRSAAIKAGTGWPPPPPPPMTPAPYPHTSDPLAGRRRFNP